MKKRGFIQIPILIAIIIGTALFGGVGYAVYEVAKPSPELPSEEVIADVALEFANQEVSLEDSSNISDEVVRATESEIQALKEALETERLERLASRHSPIRSSRR